LALGKAAARRVGNQSLEIGFFAKPEQLASQENLAKTE